MREELIWAAKDGNVEEVRILLEAGADINSFDDDGWTPLIRASESGHIDVVKLLLGKGAQVDQQNKYHYTALIYASWEGHTDILKRLIDQGAQMNIQDDDGYTALLWASFYGKTDAVKLLADSGAQLNIQGRDGYTALMRACSSDHGHTDIVKSLLQKGAHLDIQNEEGWTALMLASWEGYFEHVKLLVEQGAQLNLQNQAGETALIKASYWGYTDIVKLLLNKGADTMIKDNTGMTAKAFAQSKGYMQIVVLLDKHDGCINKTSSSKKIFNDDITSNTNCEVTQLKRENEILNAEIVILKRENGILKGRQVMDKTIRDRTPITGPFLDLPLEYLEDCCTSNFQVKLGEGEGGDVFLATDKEDPEIKYVVKRFHGANIQGDMEESFCRELEALRHLRHPNVARLYGSIRIQNYNLLLLEYVSSESLSSFLATPMKRQLLSSWTRVNILCELATTLLFLHHGDEGKQKYTILHRDIRSYNICLDNKYTVKLISISPTLNKNSKATIDKGSRGYMCPVYAEGAISDYKSACDVYSFGVVMLEMITGCLQNVQGDLVLRYKVSRKLVDAVDKTAGTGWDYYLTPLAELALHCLEYSLNDRPTFKAITNDLSRIRILMSGCVAADPDDNDSVDDDHDQNNSEKNKVDCSLCFMARAQDHGITCSKGHFFCNTCCIHSIFTYCNSRSHRANLSCPLCNMVLSLNNLTPEVPIEYMILLQYVQSRSVDMTKMDEQSNGKAFRQRTIESIMQSPWNKDVDSVETLETAMKKVNDQVLSVWKNFAKTAIEGYPCPQYVIIKPSGAFKDRKNLPLLFREKITIFFVCQHSWQLIEAFDKVEAYDWVVRVAPWANTALKMLVKLGMFKLDSYVRDFVEPKFPEFDRTGIMPLHNSLESGVGVLLNRIVETKFPEFNLKCVKAFENAYYLSPDEISGKLCQDEVVMNVLKDAYTALVDEAKNPINRGWKDKLRLVNTPDGIKWVKTEFVEEYDQRI